MKKPIRKLIRSICRYRDEWRNRRFFNKIKASRLFSPQFYLEQNEDVRARGTDPLQHYIDIGWLEQRQPHPGFDPKYYHAANWDSIRFHTNPLAHYVEQGRWPNLWCEGGVNPILFGFPAPELFGEATPEEIAIRNPMAKILLVAPNASPSLQQTGLKLCASFHARNELQSFAIFSRLDSANLNQSPSTTVIELEHLQTNRNRVSWQIDRLVQVLHNTPPVCLCVAGPLSRSVAKRLLCYEFDLRILLDEEAFYSMHTAGDVGVSAASRYLWLHESGDPPEVSVSQRKTVQTCSQDELCSALQHTISLRTQSIGNFRPRAADKPLVVFSSPDWSISGVNTFTELLARELQHHGFRTEIFFTRDPYKSGNPEYLPSVPFRIISRRKLSSEERWQAIVEHLTRSAPCIFVPNYDYFASSVSGVLGDNVGIVGIVHSDDLDHYEHVNRLGRYWNHIVAVSEKIREETIAINPGWSDKTSTIHYGLEPASGIPHSFESENPRHREPLRLIYTGRLVNYQKEVLDFVPLAYRLQEAGVDYELTLVGDGECKAMLEDQMAPLIQSGRVKLTGRLGASEIDRLLSRSDVFLLLSKFEGLPLSLLEAFKHGCVPMVNTIESGIPDVIEHGVNGFVIPKSDLGTYVCTLKTLHEDRVQLQRMKRSSQESLIQKSLTLDEMVGRYADVFRKVLADISADNYRRPPVLLRSDHLGQLLLPPGCIHHPDDIVIARRRKRAA